MSTRDRILQIAAVEIGVVEDAGQNEDSQGRIAEYRAAVRDRRYRMKPGDAYCAAFVSWVLEKAGRPIRHEHGEGLSWVPWLMQLAQARGAWYTSEEQLALGDLILFSFGGLRPDHVGFVDGLFATSEGALGVYTTEANVGRPPDGGVKAQKHDLSMTSVLGFVDVVGL